MAGLILSGAAAGTMAFSGAGAYTVSAATWQENANRIFEYLTQDLGYTEAAACGIMANIRCESTFNPQAWNAGGGSYGLCQWTGGRYSRLRNWCGSNGFDYTTIEGQLAYLEYELNAHYPGVEEYLRTVDNTADGAYDAGQYYCYHFEAPASRGSVSVYRGGLAKGTFWETYRPAEWYKVDGIWHYILRDGSYHTDWLTIEGETFYLDKEGNRISGWRTIDGGRYYFADNGVMVTGWQKIDGKDYYFGQDGSLVTGLVHSGDDWFLLDQAGNVQASAAMESFAPMWIASARERDASLTETVPAETVPSEAETLAAASQKSPEEASAKTGLLAAADTETAPFAAAGAGTGLLASADAEAGDASLPVSGLLMGEIDDRTSDSPAAAPALTAMDSLQEEAAMLAAARAQEETASSSAHAVSAMTEEAATMAVAQALASAANATGTAAVEMTDSTLADSTFDGPASSPARDAYAIEGETSAESIEESAGEDDGEREPESASYASAAEAMLAAAQTLQESSEAAGSFEITQEIQEEPTIQEEPISGAEKTADETAATTAAESSAESFSEASATEGISEEVPAAEDAANERTIPAAQAEDEDVTAEAAEEIDADAVPASASTQEMDTGTADAAETSAEDSMKDASPRIRLIWKENYEKDQEKEKGKGMDKEIPSVSLDEIDDLVSVLHERDLLIAETEQGTDITSEMTAEFSEEVKKPGDYTVTFQVTHTGKSARQKALLHITR